MDGVARPVTSRTLGARLGIEPAAIWAAMLVMEMQGSILRGIFEGGEAAGDEDVEWCERRLLQRIHKERWLGCASRSTGHACGYMQWLMRWQRVAPRSQLSGEAGGSGGSAPTGGLRSAGDRMGADAPAATCCRLRSALAGCLMPGGVVGGTHLASPGFCHPWH